MLEEQRAITKDKVAELPEDSGLAAMEPVSMAAAAVAAIMAAVAAGTAAAAAEAILPREPPSPIPRVSKQAMDRSSLPQTSLVHLAPHPQT